MKLVCYRLKEEQDQESITYLETRSSFLPEVQAPRHVSQRFNCTTLHCSGDSRGSIAPGMSDSVKTILLFETEVEQAML